MAKKQKVRFHKGDRRPNNEQPELSYTKKMIKRGKDIIIEERGADEVRTIMGKYIAPKRIKVFNPAFDVTPNRLVTAIITEKGIFRRPYRKTLKKLYG